jgi:hypothetical protein
VTIAHRKRTRATDTAGDVIEWLLASKEPAVRWLARTEVLGLDGSDAGVRRDKAKILDGPIVSTLLGLDDGREKPPHPYAKWHGAHWRLVSLVELGIPAGDPRAIHQFDRVLAWLANPRHVAAVPVIQGRARRCGSQEGNALAVASRLGQVDDPRVQLIASNLVRWQWPDGGWNCDIKPAASHSSFHESISPMWGLAEYAKATGDRSARAAASRTADFVLRHEVYRSERTGEPLNPSVTIPRWPPYWRYDMLRGLTILGRAGKLPDRRTEAALDELLRRRKPDGTWRATKRWWKAPGSPTQGEAVDWRADETEDRMITIWALATLRAAGRSANVRNGALAGQMSDAIPSVHAPAGLHEGIATTTRRR